MRVVVFGAGAVGSLFGARLAAGGAEVTLVGRSEHVQAIGSSGLIVEGVRPGRFEVGAVEHLAPGTEADAVFAGVKSFDLESAGRAIAGAIRSPVPVLAPQNGLGIELDLAKGLENGGWAHPLGSIVRAVHSVPATLLGPGRVRQAGSGEIVLPKQGEPPVPGLGVWGSLLETTGFPVRASDRFDWEVWRKALLNAAINPVTADFGILNGELRKDPWRGQAIALLEEGLSVAATEGFAFDLGDLERDLWAVVHSTAANRSSMLQDIDRGRRTEIEAISGRILKAGERRGLPLAATRRAVERIRVKAAAGSHAPSSSRSGTLDR